MGLIYSLLAKYLKGILCPVGKGDMLCFRINFKSLVVKKSGHIMHYAVAMLDRSISMISTEAAAHRYLQPNYANQHKFSMALRYKNV